MFSPANEPDHVISGAAASDWHQRILPKIRERYSGLVVAKMANPIFADYKGYDFIGITLLEKRNKESIRREVMQMKKLAKRDGVQGVMISEFSLPPGRSPERSRGPKPSGRKLANYLEWLFLRHHEEWFTYILLDYRIGKYVVIRRKILLENIFIEMSKVECLLMLRCYGEAAMLLHYRRDQQRWSFPMTHPFDVRKFDRPFDQNRTLVAVIELSQTSWLVGGMVPGLSSPLTKFLLDAERAV